MLLPKLSKAKQKPSSLIASTFEAICAKLTVTTVSVISKQIACAGIWCNASCSHKKSINLLLFIVAPERLIAYVKIAFRFWL